MEGTMSEMKYCGGKLCQADMPPIYTKRFLQVLYMNLKKQIIFGVHTVDSYP